MKPSNDMRPYENLSKKIEFRDGVPYWIKGYRAGETAGTLQKIGYRTIHGGVFEGKTRTIYAHRLSWYMTYGEIPEVLDHINGNKSDNRIDNLRSVSHAQNLRHIKKRHGTSSDYLGVYATTGSDKYLASIYKDGKSIRLGNFWCQIEAAHVRDQAIVEYNMTEWSTLNFPEIYS